MTDVTQILNAIEQGDPSAAEQLLPLVYDVLRKLAVQKMAQENPGQTLQATALVHEAYLRLVERKGPTLGQPKTFLFRRGRSNEANPHQKARRRKRLKRGGELAQADLPDVAELEQTPLDDLIDLDEAPETGDRSPGKGARL